MLFDGLGISPGPMIGDMADAYGVGRANGTNLFPEVRDVLDYLNDKYRLGLITEGSVETQRQQLTGQKIIEYFEAVIISGDTPWHKPELSLYKYAASKLNIDPKCIVMVGDRLDWDIQPAKEIGMQTVYLAKKGDISNKEVSDRYADDVIFNLKELQSML
ncbi:HAD-IA family hydrolase [bacterium]|nr:HAD-IA family hydrolase [bacterium]